MKTALAEAVARLVCLDAPGVPYCASVYLLYFLRRTVHTLYTWQLHYICPRFKIRIPEIIQTYLKFSGTWL